MNNYVSVIFNYHPGIPENQVSGVGKRQYRYKIKNKQTKKGPRNNDQYSSNKNPPHPDCGL